MSESMPSKVITTHLFTLLVNNVARTINIPTISNKSFRIAPETLALPLFFQPKASMLGRDKIPK
ncbi:hypothetical protein EDB51_10434 [Vibrio crassostreae]|nr:hypothetical protein EDB51_10434 [Vibrio crassostreae]